MIYKDLEAAPTSSDLMAQAGHEAERQMAFYLNRAFGPNPSVGLFHNLRIPLPPELAAATDDAVQIDHLVMHPHGFIIIESKSVSGEVEINEALEFTRVWNGRRSGMPSPIEQAKRQGDALRQILIKKKTSLRNTILGVKRKGFSSCPFDVLVAVSDRGRIKRSRRAVPEIHKADAIVGVVQHVIDVRIRFDGDPFGHVPHDIRKIKYFAKDETQRIAQFLVSSHRVRHGEQEQPASPPLSRSRDNPAPMSKSRVPVESEKLQALHCAHCRSINVEVVYAKNYCLRCKECNSYSPLSTACTKCGSTRARVRKSGTAFSRVCEACGSDIIFWCNEPEK